MAYINDIYVHVTEENKRQQMNVTEHPVEKGMTVTDYISPKPIELTIKGELIPYEGMRGSILTAALTELQRGGNLIKYSGRTSLQNAVIESFRQGYTNKITGGCTFEMTIKEIRIAASARVTSNGKSVKKQGTQQVVKKTVNTYHVVRSGDTLYNLSLKYYGVGTQFDRIYNANKAIMKRPGALTIGWRLYIP